MSFKFKKIKTTKYTEKRIKEVELALELLMYEAALSAIKAMDKKIPVDTGMAKGSLRGKTSGFTMDSNIPTLLGFTVPINPKRKRKGYSISKGANMSLLKFTRFNRILKVTFSSNILHYILNEYGDGNNNVKGWHSIEAGQEAFKRYIDTHLPEIVKSYKEGRLEVNWLK